MFRLIVLLFVLYLITTSVCSFLIVYMAIQRFLLYFFPSIGELLIIRRTRFFVVAYIFIPILSFGSYYPYAMNEMSKLEKFQKDNPDFQQISYYPVFLVSAAIRIVLINALMFISALLYLIMIWKIQKFKKTMSQTTIKPEKYIMYQVIILSVWQAYVILLFFVRSDLKEIVSIETFALSTEATLMSTFPSIQMAYLLCNRANVKEMWKLGMRLIFWRSHVVPIS